jgi:hypothetical protein
MKNDPSKPSSATRAIIFAAAAAAALMAAVAPALAESHEAPVAGLHAAGKVKSIALAPGGGPLSQALADELRQRGYVITETPAREPSSGLAPASLSGADAVLQVSAVADSNGEPQVVDAQINTVDGLVLARVHWRNYFGGWRGPKGAPPSFNPHRNLVQAAHEIAANLAGGLNNSQL